MSDHTWEIKPSQEEAEHARRRLEADGWVAYPEHVPLVGQSGYYCVRTLTDEDGSPLECTHSVRWNLFDVPLHPVTIMCRDDADLLSFIWSHGRHQGFRFFEYGDGDVGFVCHCRAENGCSLVLCVSSSDFAPVTPQTLAALSGFARDS